VDVRGLDVEEACRLVDRAIDRCVVTGMGALEVVHGKGTGVLRTEIGRRLAGDPRVRGASVGGEGRYDDGLTLVEF
jgi:DNA mismatch repair protein MutS2